MEDRNKKTGKSKMCDAVSTNASIAPAPGAHFELAGSSSAVINLMDSATVTGVLSGTSALSYYGSDIVFDLSVAITASLARLGGTL